MPPRTKRSGLDHRAYRRAKNRLRQNARTCWLCGKWIDVDLPSNDPMSWTADHVIPRSKGGHLLGELRAAHRSCNSSRGNRPPERIDQLPTTRQW
ncbi:HNH endonuclease [Antrihabitans cavernicola]|uniref:HNH endonuclease n=1 Tax=Antrihabitans cavernicola TaxID=2495913 RepID=A0A5A7SBA5_9NOCA|nr:HNH endonuclease [Spelaeibacter cavernicola]KAA0021815.1 HNH endonuclease [Spelaeibacter cavernicola]